MHVRVVVPVIVVQRVDHRLGLLRRRRAVQVHQRLSVHAPLQDWKVFADALNVHHLGSVDTSTVSPSTFVS